MIFKYLARSAYMLLWGRWVGERTVDIRDNRGLAMLITGRSHDGSNRKIWWMRGDWK